MSDRPDRSDRPRLAVLASGSGTNLQAVIDACALGRPDGLDAEIVLVAGNREEAYALTRARDAGIDVLVRPHSGVDRDEYDKDLAYQVALAGADLVVLAGWDRILTDAFLSRHRVINLHPAKPGAFPGLGAIERAFDAAREGRIDSGGVMVHYVPDEGVDNGPTIVWEAVPILADDTIDTFTERVHGTEHRLLVEAIAIALGQRPARSSESHSSSSSSLSPSTLA